RIWAAGSRHRRWGPPDPPSRPSSRRRARRSAGRTGTRRRAGRSRGRTSWPRCRTAAWVAGPEYGPHVADVLHHGDVEVPWSWDETLYAGSAGYYRSGRLPYPGAVADGFARELRLDGTQRL